MKVVLFPFCFHVRLPALSSGVVTAILAHSPSLKDNLTPLFIYTMVTEVSDLHACYLIWSYNFLKNLNVAERTFACKSASYIGLISS